MHTFKSLVGLKAKIYVYITGDKHKWKNEKVLVTLHGKMY